MPNKKAKGKRKKTRHKFKRKNRRDSVNVALKDLDIGTKVHINIDSGIHSGLPARRFHGLTGEVVGKKGRAMDVAVMKGGKPTNIVVNAAHLKDVVKGKEVKE